MNRLMQWIAMAGLMVVPAGYAQQLTIQKIPAVGGGDVHATLISMGGGGGQVKDELFAGTDKFAKGASEVTEINLDPKMLGLVSGKDDDSGIARKMKFVVIHTYEYDKPGMYRMEDVEAYRKKLEDGTWSCSIHVREKDESTDICTRTAPHEAGSEMVILTAEPKELTFIHLAGNVSLADLSKMNMVKEKSGLKTH